MQKTMMTIRWVAVVACGLMTLGLMLASSSQAAVQQVKNYAEYVSSLPKGCEPVPKDCFEQAIKEGELRIYDWASWWDESLYNDFSKTFGIKIVRDNFADYDEMLTKYKLHPDLAYDFQIASDDAFGRLRDMGMTSELNHAWIPNVNKYLKDEFKKLVLDPGYRQTVQVSINIAGYAINSKFLDDKDPRLGSWAYLLVAPKDLKDHGRLTIRDNMLAVISAALNFKGYSLNSDDEKELVEAKKVLMELKPYIKVFDSWPKRAMLESETWLVGPNTVGDFLAINEEVPTIKAYLPKEGSNIRSLCMAIPKGSQHRAAAHLWFNYIFRPDSAVKLTISTGQSSGHKAVNAQLAEKYRKWPGMEVSQEYLNKCEFLGPKAYTGKGLKLRTEVWEELKK